MRLFYAIELSSSMQEALHRAQKALSHLPGNISWTKKENIHLTIKFLGDTEDKKIPALKRALDTIAKQSQTFSISLDQLSAFPNTQKPRIIWCGVKNEGDIIPVIAKQLDKRLTRLGYKKAERPFRAHVTIGRVRHPIKRSNYKQALSDFSLDTKLAYTVNKLSLIKSKLTSAGSVYSPVHRAFLNKYIRPNL